MLRALDILRRAAAPQDSWPKHDLYDAVFFVRVLLALVLGVSCGVLGLTGLMTFLMFAGACIFCGSAWLRWQGIDEAEYDDPNKISAQPLGFEGVNAAVPLFVLTWVTSYTLCHGGGAGP